MTAELDRALRVFAHLSEADKDRLFADIEDYRNQTFGRKAQLRELFVKAAGAPSMNVGPTSAGVCPYCGR